MPSSLYAASENEKDLEDGGGGGGGGGHGLAGIRRHSSQDAICRPPTAATTAATLAAAGLEKTATTASTATVTGAGGGGGGQQRRSVFRTLQTLSQSLTPPGRSGAAERTTADFQAVQGTPWEVRWADRDPENPLNWSLARRGWILGLIAAQTVVVYASADSALPRSV